MTVVSIDARMLHSRIYEDANKVRIMNDQFSMFDSPADLPVGFHHRKIDRRVGFCPRCVQNVLNVSDKGFGCHAPIISQLRLDSLHGM